MLNEHIEFAPERYDELLAGVPASPAVFLLRGEDAQAEPYVSKTANLRRRLQRLLGPVEERTKKLNLGDRVRLIEYSATGSDFESGFLLYSVLRSTFPKTYQKRLRFRFAPFVKLHLDNEYPRASITTRLSKAGGRNLYYGPFVSRIAAEKFMVAKINDSKFVASIESNQTQRLITKFRQTFASEAENLAILDRVALMTPENIHVNSFMYEPIVDMSDDHLKRLYADLAKLV